MMPIAAMRLKSTSAAALGIDSYATGVKALHALKRKWTGYAGSCIRVRRSSDSTEQDIGFVSSAIDAAVDSAAAIAFCGAGDGFVTKIYDQSGSGNDWVQATATKQPQCISAGSWLGWIYFDASNDSMQSTNNCGAVAVYHIGALFTKRSWSAGTDAIFFERGTNLGGVAENGNAMTYASGTAFPWRLWKSAGSGNYQSNGVATASDPVRPTLGHAVWGEMDYTQSTITNSLRIFVGASQMTSAGTTTVGTVGTGTVGSAVKWFLGARNNATFFADMNWGGDILAEGTISDANKAAMQAILER